MKNWICKGLIGLMLSLTAASPAFAADTDKLAGLDILNLPEWTVTSSSYGPTLLLSDSPEMVSEDGVMYEDAVQGDARLFFHHVNATTVPKKIMVILENAGSEPAQVTVYQHGLAGPSSDWLAVGKQAQLNYFSGNDIYLVEVPAGGFKQLSYELADMVVEPNMLINGIYDFKTDKPVKVRVMMLPVNADIKKFAAQIKVLPPDQYHLRGTFVGANRMLIPNKVYDPAKDGPVALTLADNSIDRYIEGIDATDGCKVQNYGNYGVVYKLFLPSEHNGKIKYFLNPRGGTYAGALGVKYQHVNGAPLATPPDRLFFGENKITDFAPVGTFDGGESLWLTFSPPGASNLPVKLVLLPEAFANK